MKLNYFSIILLGGVMFGFSSLNISLLVEAQETNSTALNMDQQEKPFILLAKIWGGDFPANQTVTYDSFSNQSVNVLGKEVSTSKTSPNIIGKIATDLQFSNIVGIESDSGICDITQVCYLLQVVQPFGVTGSIESHWVTWTSDSNQTYYGNLNQIMSQIQKLGL